MIPSIFFFIWLQTLEIEPTPSGSWWVQIIFSNIGAVAGGIVGIVFWVIKRRIKRKAQAL